MKTLEYNVGWYRESFRPCCNDARLQQGLFCTIRSVKRRRLAFYLRKGIEIVFFQQLVNGLTLGSAYAVIAIGYTLVFGVLNIVNMAHGGIFMMGAYIGLLLVTEAGFGIFPALIGAMIGGAVLELRTGNLCSPSSPPPQGHPSCAFNQYNRRIHVP